MKEKIIIFIVGLLLGAIIATGSILVFDSVTNKNTNTNSNDRTQMPFENRGNGQGRMNNNGEQPPELPNGQNGNA
jgi:hypothetical protein